MGLLDDAIREHLELKRLHGAEAEELSRLEQEAFSPPSRPGDPDFGPGPGTSDDPEDVAAELFEQGGPGSEGADAGAITGSELGRLEHSGLDDTVPHPVTDEGDAGGEPPEAPEAAIFDADADLDLDLELDLDDDLDLDAPAAPAAPADPAEADDDFLAGADLDSAFDLEPERERPAEPAPLPDDKPPTGEAPVPLPPAEDEPAAPAEEPAEEPEGDDLLEETPEFLKDAPDGESLWFEQGKPEDFDFDDD